MLQQHSFGTYNKKRILQAAPVQAVQAAPVAATYALVSRGYAAQFCGLVANKSKAGNGTLHGTFATPYAVWAYRKANSLQLQCVFVQVQGNNCNIVIIEDGVLSSVLY